MVLSHADARAMCQIVAVIARGLSFGTAMEQIAPESLTR